MRRERQCVVSGVTAGDLPEHWLFDLDGCLVDSFAGTELRPYALDVLVALRQADHRVEIWSAGGAEYAERVARRVGIHDVIHGYWTKERGKDGKWSLPAATAGRTVVCVDDQPEGIPAGPRQIPVFPYLGRNDHDAALLPILDGLRGETA